MRPTPRQIIGLSIAIAALGVATGVVVTLTRGMATPGPTMPLPTQTVLARRPAPDFTLRTFAGKPLSLTDFRGKTVVLNFWASWCTPCKQEMPNLERAWKEFGNRGLVVLGVDIEDDMEDAAAFLKKFGITYPNVYDPGQERMNAYQVTAIPTTIFLDRDLRIQRRYVGGYLGSEGYKELRKEILGLLTPSP